MVCLLGSGRMAAMARLLAAGRLPQTMTDEVGKQKLAAQYIHREFREADEANLLDEEDMHIFDLKPMTDPLHLVSCNACKKPVKASQYAAHAEICKSLSAAENILLELDGYTGNKKPPRKERKKLLATYANQAARNGDQGKPVYVPHYTAPESHLNTQITYSASMYTKVNSLHSDTTIEMDCSGVTPGKTDHSAGAMPAPLKRSKLIAADSQQRLDHMETASSITQTLCTSIQEAITCKEYVKGLSVGSQKSCDHIIGYQVPQQVYDCFLPTKDVPHPLATKMFYSQRNNRLRSAISHLYCNSSTVGDCDRVDPKVLQENAIESLSSLQNSLPEQIDDLQEKRGIQSVILLQNQDRILAQCSEVYLGRSGGHSAGHGHYKSLPD